MQKAIQHITVHLERILFSLSVFIRSAKADKIHSNDTLVSREYRNHFAIEIGPGWLTMQAKDNFSCPLVHVMNTHPIHFDIVRLKREARQVAKALIRRANNWHVHSLHKSQRNGSCLLRANICHHVKHLKQFESRQL